MTSTPTVRMRIRDDEVLFFHVMTGKNSCMSRVEVFEAHFFFMTMEELFQWAVFSQPFSVDVRVGYNLLAISEAGRWSFPLSASSQSRHP